MLNIEEIYIDVFCHRMNKYENGKIVSSKTDNFVKI